MKKFFSLVLVAVFGASSLAWAQIIPGRRFELSTAASLINLKYNDADDSTTVVNIPLRLACYIYTGLAVEPEVLLTIVSNGNDSTTGIMASGNICYNFDLKGIAVPFILAGAGYGNGQELVGYTTDLETGILALQFGVGVKLLLNNTAAVRLEYRYLNYSGKKEYIYSLWGGAYSYTVDYGRSDQKFMVGISIFL
jgi:opacity protein-like surface antigen